LQISEYTAGDGRWSYSRGVVRDLQNDGVVADIVRNYGMFWFAWVTQTGREFLLCGEDYQGYNVLELSTGLSVLTFPTEAYEGMGYCWAAVHPSPDARTLAVEGCYWACPYSVTFYDFSDPTASPLPELARFEDLDKVEGWVSPSAFKFTAGEGKVHHEHIWKRTDVA
jgi:hypothetical protein